MITATDREMCFLAEFIKFIDGNNRRYIQACEDYVQTDDVIFKEKAKAYKQFDDILHELRNNRFLFTHSLSEEYINKCYKMLNTEREVQKDG